VLDFTGLAQKNGAVVSQVRIAPTAGDLHAGRIGPGAVDLLLGADMVVSAAADNAGAALATRSGGVVNLDETPTAAVVRQRDATLPTPPDARARANSVAAPGLSCVRRRRTGAALFGDTVDAHTLMLGYAWQKGLLPLSGQAIERTLELNGAAVALNKRAFAWGRIAAADPQALSRIAPREAHAPAQNEMSLDELLAHRIGALTAYQGAAYAQRYRDIVLRAVAAERRAMPGTEEFSRAVAVSAYRVMAYKDEYEVARLYAAPEFKAIARGTVLDDAKNLAVARAAPPVAIDAATGRPKKRKFGPWMLKAMGVLAAFRGLRGTVADPFGYTRERRAERALAAEFLADAASLSDGLSGRNHARAVALAKLPQEVRGFGPVKEAAMEAYAAQRAALRHAPVPAAAQAAPEPVTA
jgi:indolepyruvate ferredoxin oxidoreductase